MATSLSKNRLFWASLSAALLVALIGAPFLFEGAGKKTSSTQNTKMNPEHLKNLASESMKAVRERSDLLYRKKHYAPMIRVYENMLAKDPSNVGIQQKLGQTYFYAGEPEKAAKLLQTVFDVAESDADTDVILAELSLRKRDYSLTRMYAESALRKKPDHAKARELLDSLLE